MSDDIVKENTLTVKIPHEIAQIIEKRIENTDFDASSYVSYVLQEVLSNVEEQDQPESKVPEEDPAPSQEQVQERLKRLESLGYLD
ncbi:CopG family transcriptional regulator [Candidatus Woesearchaeota archaeon]|nr:CopG family transcriptional regulator [Candidatus Woesearchaeota archaeon]MBT5397226.1 CopG family transcriptional regulator [Candidatus Woesearchaeota archaeon]MBT5924417.1 CopG family transcriptional regulator [Candidatus Woesearchaeota archaeon]MBT6367228.1 CopG family transcriptional regulator [Candidatus Woesearchaeota archaeon]MBT7762626.1 CopG family transcriptional regulator [Candidatus Woesearchaeota archaeon]